MCSPLAFAGASAAIGTVSSIANYFGMQSAHHSAVGAANLNYSMREQQIGQENAQLSEQQSEESLSNSVEAARSFGAIANSASGMGLGFSSEHQLISARAAGYNRTMGIEDENYANKRTALQGDLTGASIERSTAIANAPKENLFQLGMNIPGSAMGAGQLYGQLGGRFGIQPAATATGVS